MTEVRLAHTRDAQQIRDIYSPSILTAAASFETEVPSVQEVERRIETCLQKFPWIVCVVDGSVAGYVYASKHRERSAYQWTCECSAYIGEKYKGKGMGEELYRVLFALLKMQGLRNVYAGITLPNPASVRLHEKHGFRHFATYENIGYKLNSWQTVGWWQLRINEYDRDPLPPSWLPMLDRGLIDLLFEESARRIQAKLIG